MEQTEATHISVLTGEVNKKFLYSFVLVLGIGAIQYGYSIGVYNAMQIDF